MKTKKRQNNKRKKEKNDKRTIGQKYKRTKVQKDKIYNLVHLCETSSSSLAGVFLIFNSYNNKKSHLICFFNF